MHGCINTCARRALHWRSPRPLAAMHSQGCQHMPGLQRHARPACLALLGAGPAAPPPLQPQLQQPQLQQPGRLHHRAAIADRLPTELQQQAAMASRPEQLLVDEDEYEEEYEEEYEDELEEIEDEEAVLDAAAAAMAAESAAAAAAAAADPGDEGVTEEGDEEEDEEEEEEEETEDDEVAQDWDSLRVLPEAEQILDLLAHLQDAGRRSLTILLLGKSGVGKSSTLNSLLGEKAAAVSAFKLQPDTESSTAYLRQVSLGEAGGLDGFRVKFIDTCGLEDPEAGDTVNYAALERIAEDVRGVPIDAVLYVDRLDLYRVEPLDKRIMQSITETFGRRIWQKTLLVLTHGNLPMPPPGTSFETFSERRVELLRRAVRGRFFRPALPAVLAENSDACKVDAERCRVLPDGSRWLVDLWGSAADMALSGPPYAWRKGLSRRPNSSAKWLIPLVAYGQYLAWKTLLVPRLQREEDKQAEADEAAWVAKAAERKRLGIGPPLKPTAENAWRLEQMYDDD